MLIKKCKTIQKLDFFIYLSAGPAKNNQTTVVKKASTATVNGPAKLFEVPSKYNFYRVDR